MSRKIKNMLDPSFRCQRCKKTKCEDYKYYPICPKCSNSNILKGEIDKKEAQSRLNAKSIKQRKINSLKNNSSFYSNNTELCKLIVRLREKEKYTWQKISDHLRDNGYKTKSGAEWSRIFACDIYRQYKKTIKRLAKIKREEKKLENQ